MTAFDPLQTLDCQPIKRPWVIRLRYRLQPIHCEHWGAASQSYRFKGRKCEAYGHNIYQGELAVALATIRDPLT